MAVEVKVYESDNASLVANLSTSRQVRALNGKTQLEDDGDGTVTIDHDHPDVAELTEGRFIQVVDGAETPLAFRIDRKREVRIPPPDSGEAEKVVVVSGKGPRSILKLGRVLPWMAVGKVPLSTATTTGRRTPRAAAPS